MEKPQRKPYRNSVRSERMIVHAYVELMQKKDISKITVTDVVKEADINRSTFYAHFSSIKDVSEKIAADVMDNITEFVRRGSEMTEEKRDEVFNSIVSFLESDLKFYKALIASAGSEKLLKQLRENVVSLYLSDEKVMSRISDRKSFEIFMRMFIGGYMSIIEDWAHETLSATLEDCTKVVQACIEAFIAFYTASDNK